MNQKTKIKFDVLAIFCILIFCFSLTPITFQNDTYYSIAIGKHIIQTGTVDMQDPFSWHEGLPYTYPHLAYDIGTYLVYQLGETVGIGGLCAVYIATALLCMLLGVILYVTCKYVCKNQLVSFLVTMAVIYLLKDFIAARAQLVTYICFALTILFIEKFLQTKKKRYPIYLILISICLANSHVAVWPFYFVLYLPYVAEYMIAAIADSNFVYRIQIRLHEKRLKRIQKKQLPLEQIEKEQQKLQQLKQDQEKALVKDAKRRENPYKVILQKEPAAKWLIVIMLICSLTGLLTPLGTTPYTYLAKTMQGNTTQNINEHQPLTLFNNKPVLITFSLFLAVLIFTDTKLKLRDFFMLAGLVLLTLMSRRQAAVFAVICSFIFTKLVTSFLTKYDKHGTEAVLKVATSALGKIFTMLLVILVSFLFYRGKMNDQFVSTSSYPVAAADYILENIDMQSMRLFNEYNYGSYLLYRGIPVFIDSRADLYAPEFNATENQEGRDIFSDYINISNINVYYEDKFSQYEITHVILQKNTDLNRLLARDSHYVVCYQDDHFIIYERFASNS